MPRRRQLHERVRDRMEGKDPDAAEKQAKAEKETKKFTGSPAEVVAQLSPKQREALYDVLVDYSYRDFKSEEEEAAEEDDEDE